MPSGYLCENTKSKIQLVQNEVIRVDDVAFSVMAHEERYMGISSTGLMFSSSNAT
jgi:hypothetical protein